MKYQILAFIALFAIAETASAQGEEQDVFTDPLAGPSLVKKREKDEAKVIHNPFVITPYKANYFLPFTYNSHPNNKPFANDEDFSGEDLDNLEAKFQISFKMPLAIDILGSGDLFFAYTNRSWWQVYNKDSSSPFRETVHEPELFLMYKNDWKIGRFTNSFYGFGADHQSNGRAGSLSRSWNRLYANAVFDSGPLAFAIRAWWRIPEEDKTSVTDSTGDDNPDIRHYMGNFEFTGLYGFGEQRYSMLLRNNLEKHNRGAVQLTWSYPIHNNIRLYVQYFNGYGESLIDYNAHTERLGVGIALNDLL